MMPTDSNGKQQSKDGRVGDIRAVTRAVAVLTAFEDAEELSLADLAERTGLPKPTVFRLAQTLENAGFLARSPEDYLFHLGPRLISTARLVLSRGLPAVARPHLEQLSRQFGHTVNLAVFDDGQVLFLDVIESRASLRMVSGVGNFEPLHATAAGKAIAAYLDPSDLDAVMTVPLMRALTPHTVTSRTRFEAVLQEIRERGYSTDREEFRLGAHCVAGAIMGRHGVAGAISLSATADQLPEEDFPVVGKAVRQVTDEISEALGGRRPTGSAAAG
jgi:DNA-binding IclR family transcriptional regulator